MKTADQFRKPARTEYRHFFNGANYLLYSLAEGAAKKGGDARKAAILKEQYDMVVKRLQSAADIEISPVYHSGRLAEVKVRVRNIRAGHNLRGVRLMRRDYEYIVLGLGGLGSAAPYWLSRRAGADVLGLEQFELGHVRGESQDHSRIIRLSYHAPNYIALAKRAYECWAAPCQRILGGDAPALILVPSLRSALKVELRQVALVVVEGESPKAHVTVERVKPVGLRNRLWTQQRSWRHGAEEQAAEI